MPIVGSGYPVSLVLSGRRCLVVGGGEFALGRVRGLLETGASVTLLTEDDDQLFEHPALVVLRRPYEAGEAGRYHLVVAASGAADLDAQVHADAEAAGVLVNVVDDPDRSSFILPAIHREGAVSVAVSSDGNSPALSSFLRDEIRASLADAGLLGHLGELAATLSAVRGALRTAGVHSAGRDWRALIEELRHAADPDAVANAWLTAQLNGTARGGAAGSPE